MIASLLLLTGLALAADGRAVVAWAAEAPPDARTRARVEKLTGAAEHVAWADLALAPSPLPLSD